MRKRERRKIDPSKTELEASSLFDTLHAGRPPQRVVSQDHAERRFDVGRHLEFFEVMEVIDYLKI